MAFTEKELIKMQSRSLDTKINVTISKLLELFNYTKFKVIVAFSGGKDSTVLLDIVAKVWSNTKDIHNNSDLMVVFANTSNEFCGVEHFVKDYCKYIEVKHNIKINLKIVRSKLNYNQVIQEVGYPIASKKTARQLSDIRRDITKLDINFEHIKSNIKDDIESATYLRQLGFKAGSVLYLTGYKKDNSLAKSFKLAKKWYPLITAPFNISEKCCDRLKKEPMKIIQKEFNVSPIIAEMADDSKTRKDKYLETGCNAFYEDDKAKSKPMGFWLEQDVLKYININELPYLSVYGDLVFEDNQYKFTREQRTGCKLCLFGIQFDKERFKRLNLYEPSTMRYALTPIENGGCGYQTVIDYLNTYCKTNIII
jgi:3'-phosphoadenosine 5'-phosphosulfate sulfotransferase (PAPS reductase)/FAD synthetase